MSQKVWCSVTRDPFVYILCCWRVTHRISESGVACDLMVIIRIHCHSEISKLCRPMNKSWPELRGSREAKPPPPQPFWLHLKWTWFCALKCSPVTLAGASGCWEVWVYLLITRAAVWLGFWDHSSQRAFVVPKSLLLIFLHHFYVQFS